MQLEQPSSDCKCPLCPGIMRRVLKYYVCENHPLHHRCLILEVESFWQGEMTWGTLRHRARIRMGKSLEKRRCGD